MVGSKKKLGDILVNLGYISYEQLKFYLDKQKKLGKRLGVLLIEDGILTEETLLEVLERQLGMDRILIDSVQVDSNVVKIISKSLAEKYKLIPIKIENGKLLVLMSDPLNIFAIEDVSIASGLQVIPAIATEAEISNAIQKFYAEDFVQRATEELRLKENEKKQVVEVKEEIQDINDAPVVKIIDTIIDNAIRRRASDIHIEPFQNKITIRYRIDGKLNKAFDVPIESLAVLITRIKILSGMDIAEKRLPQDGRMLVINQEREVDLRVSIIPTVYGEKVVIRILDKDGMNIDKSNLGMSEENIKKLDSIITKPYGIILVTGPTGSGKSTTLYSILKELNDESKNIITIEDPVEFNIEGVNQINVNTKAGLNFAMGLRSILRQDPDVIMIGEIRDGETAEIAVRAAITGHLVLSTLHTNDAPSSIVRLIDMGVPPYLISTSIMGIIAQRLVRKICPNCSKEYEASFYEKNILEVPKDEKLILKRGKGCAFCNNSGYIGRVGVYEILDIDRNLRDMISQGESVDKIRSYAESSGMNSLRQATKEQVISGNTTVEEMIRITLLGD